jgi:hypothetical protein
LNEKHQLLNLQLKKERNQIVQMSAFLQSDKDRWEKYLVDFFNHPPDSNQFESDRLRNLFLDHISHSHIFQKESNEIYEIFQSFFDNETEFQSFF